jgi:hypothetical protein
MENPTPARSIWTRIFLSPDEPRLRAGWRLSIQTVLLTILIICFAIPIYYLPRLGEANSDVFTLASSVAEFFAITGSIFLVRRFLDRRSFSSLGFELDRWALIDLAVGIAITFLLMGGIYLAMNLSGWIRFEGFAWETDPPGTVLGSGLVILLAFVLVGWNEELLSRGYHLQTIASGTNIYWGVALSSLVFALLHITNPSADWVSTLGIFLAGLFLASGYLGTRQLWLSIGLHIGWNFFEGPAFGFPVSGISSYHFLRITVTGPSYWTGGAFGPEAGLIVFPTLVVGVLLVFVYSHLRYRWNPAPASVDPVDPT